MFIWFPYKNHAFCFSIIFVLIIQTIYRRESLFKWKFFKKARKKPFTVITFYYDCPATITFKFLLFRRHSIIYSLAFRTSTIITAITRTIDIHFTTALFTICVCIICHSNHPIFLHFTYRLVFVRTKRIAFQSPMLLCPFVFLFIVKFSSNFRLSGCKIIYIYFV